MAHADLSPRMKRNLDQLFADHGYSDYRWIDPKQIIVAQWVRMKCIYGCGEFGRSACCPPNNPSVAECERFFQEYAHAVVFRFEKTVDKPEDRHAWTRKVNTGLWKLEREVFLAGNERAFLLYMDSCCLCKDCAGDRTSCQHPRMARPSPESMAVDVYSTVRRFGFSVEVRTDYDQAMSRFAFLLIV
ncbi:MAG: DUF2284 domain-containing protein [Desulfobacteraceae bacterium]|nr:DUF2284 domain-containing protein [Desulfobacteraceae bacterium]